MNTISITEIVLSVLLAGALGPVLLRRKKGLLLLLLILVCTILLLHGVGNDSNLLIVFYVQIMPDDFVMQLHRF